MSDFKLIRDLVLGDVVRLFDGSFGDGRVTEINYKDKIVIISRPFIPSAYTDTDIRTNEHKTRLYMTVHIEQIEIPLCDTRPVPVVK